MIRLYDYELSGNCYKLRLLMHWLGLACERIPVDFHPGRAHKSETFLHTVNPLGQLPVLDDDGFVLRDAQACLVYLASRYDAGGHWYPDDARMRGQTGPSAGESHFELAHDGRRFTGRGTRSYDATVNGQRQRCRISYEALLRKLDT